MSRSILVRILKNVSKWKTLVLVFYLTFISIISFEMYHLYKYINHNDRGVYITPFGPEFEGPKMLAPIPSGGNWQTVAGTRHMFYVFSAHYDERVERHIRVIGATSPYGGDTVYCQLFLKGDITDHIFVPGIVKPISGDSDAPFAAVFVICPFSQDYAVPWSVAVVSSSLPLATNHLRTQWPLPLSTGKSTIAACVQPIDNYFSQNFKLIEFIELNILLGVNHFVFYNQSMTSEIGCLLSHYVRQGQATVLQWNFDMWNKNYKKKLQPESYLAALNDCVYRTMYKYTYSTFLSLDDYLVPRTTDTLQELLKSKESQSNSKKIGAYSMMNAYFFLEWPDGTWAGKNILGDYVTTVYKTRRAPVSPSQELFSYLFRPELVLVIGPEFAPALVPGYHTYALDQSEALCHQYRLCEGGTVNCTMEDSVVDVTIHRYPDRLLLAMLYQWTTAMPFCSLVNLQPNMPTVKVLNNRMFLE